jgi:hypothetical protein
MDITREIAAKVVEVVDAGLVNGVGEPVPGQMCVEAAVCYAMGLPHGDKPSCVSPALRRLKIGLNDRNWSSTQARAKGLRRLAVAQLGSAGVLDDGELIRRVAEMTIRKIVPLALRAAAKRKPDRAALLEAAAVRCEREGTRESASAAYAYAAADDASASAYASASASAYAPASAYAYAAYAATAAADAYAAADAAAYAADAAAYAAAYAAADARDRVLADYAEWVVEILIDLKAPGCQFLDLVPKV